MALKAAIRATPISPKTAFHIVAIPKIPSIMKAAFTPIAKIIFCQTTFLVFAVTSMASITFEGESVISTTSAVSMAASVLT